MVARRCPARAMDGGYHYLKFCCIELTATFKIPGDSVTIFVNLVAASTGL
jgi:hypothetical protein